MKINIKDVRFEVFNGGVKAGGQKVNRKQKCIRAIHIPTGVKAIATKERSLTQNKKAAVEALQEKIDQLIKEKKLALSKKDYEDKSEASFGSQIRTYRKVGNQQLVTDHRTNITANVDDVLNGDIDCFILENLKKGIQ